MNKYAELKKKLMSRGIEEKGLDVLGINENTFKESEIINFLKNKEDFDSLVYSMARDICYINQDSAIQRY